MPCNVHVGRQAAPTQTHSTHSHSHLAKNVLLLLLLQLLQLLLVALFALRWRAVLCFVSITATVVHGHMPLIRAGIGPGHRCAAHTPRRNVASVVATRGLACSLLLARAESERASD